MNKELYNSAINSQKGAQMPYVDFKELKQRVSIEDVANVLKLPLKKSGNQLRGGCPACGNTDDRILAITPARNLFYCFDAKKGGDQIELVCHITGLDVQDAATYLAPHSREEPTAPPAQRQEARKEAKKEITFDPAAFASKLVFSDEVAALGLTEADATRLGIGFTRGKVYFPLRDEYGFTAGFVGYADGALKMPPKLLANPSVVKLKRA
jgi:DNA primase